MSQERSFPSNVAAVTDARIYVLGALGPLTPDIADAVAIIVSELATNVVLHTSSEFTVNIERSDAEIRVAVSDRDPNIPVARTPRPDETSGRGLQLVQALAADWGVSAADDRVGKTVWFTVSLRGSVDETSHHSAESVPARGPSATRTPDARPNGPIRESRDGTGGPSTLRTTRRFVRKLHPSRHRKPLSRAATCDVSSRRGVTAHRDCD
jgi:anti-sigma regulatory factor (Ser/Thr protein kinase)